MGAKTRARRNRKAPLRAMMKSELREPACTQGSRVINRRLSKKVPRLYTTGVCGLSRRDVSFAAKNPPFSRRNAVRNRWLNSYTDLRSNVISLFKPGYSDYRGNRYENYLLLAEWNMRLRRIVQPGHGNAK